MKRRDLLVASICVSFSSLASTQDRHQKPAAVPKAVVEKPERDVGVLAVGDPAAAEFDVRNVGDAPLELQSVKAPLGVRTEGVPASVPAGGSRTVRLVLGFPAPPGELMIEVSVLTNDPELPMLRLVLRGKVQAFLLMHPGYARYIVVQHAADGTITQTVGASDGAAFRVVGVESPSPALRTSFREARPDERRPGWTGSQWRVESTLSRDAPVGALTGDIVVVTDHPRQRVARAPVSGFVRPVFAVTPPEARMGDVDPRRTPRLQLFVKNFAEQLIDLRGAESDVTGVRAELAAREPGRSWGLTLWLDAEKPPGPFEGHVRIRTANPQVPVIDIPLSGRIVRGSDSP
jgi:hypothetical protein